MANMNVTTNADLLDDGLQAVMGKDRCQNPEDWQPKQKKASKTKRTEKKPTESKTLDKDTDAQWEPARPDPNWMDRLQASVKCVFPFSALCLLVFYWQQTGLMDPAAAVPSMCVCCLMAGLGIGKHALK